MKEALSENYVDQAYIPGFNIKGEIAGLVKYRDLQEVEMNIRHYIREYAQQGLVLPSSVDLKDGRMVNQKGIPMIPRISSAERNGAVLEASMKVEDYMARALPGSMAVITSPMGPSGMRDVNGGLIEYPMTQTLVYWKEGDGYLRGVTLVSDLDKHQNRQLLLKLGVASDNLISSSDEMEEVAAIVRNPALLGPNLGYCADKVVDEILNIRGYSDIRLDLPNGEAEYRHASEYMRDLRRETSLLQYNQQAEKYIEDFRNFMLINVDNLDNDFVRRRLEQELFETILKITGTLEEFKGSRTTKWSFRSYQPLRGFQDDDYRGELAFLQNKIGCNGGGSMGVKILMGGSTYGGIFGAEGSLSGKCSKCGINHAVLGGCGFCNSCAMAA